MSSNRSSRVNNVLKNLVLGGAARILSLLFPFITRTVFVRLLGEEYLGVGGLFSSILTLLNLSELGLSSAVVYTMYKPLSEKNDQEVASLLNFYKGIYTKIMLFILGMGLLILPFLGQIVNTELPLAEIRIYYILYLANSAASYLYVWKSSLIQADQKQYIVTGASTLFTMITQIMQILILLLKRDYTLYLVAALVCTLLHNFYISWRADRMYPHIAVVTPETLPVEKQRSIFGDVKAMFAYKLGGVFLNSTDNFYINSLINVKMVGRYNNYIALSTSLTAITSYVYQSIIHSVGDFNVEHSEQEKKIILELREFKKGLPDFLEDFFVYLNTSVSAKTRLGYARDIKIFFTYLANEEGGFPTDITKFTIEDMKKVDAKILNRYADYLSYYLRSIETKDEKNVTVETLNHDRGISRKLSALRKMFKFYYQQEELEANPTELINNPKIHEKNIVRLEPDEVAKLLDTIESGAGLTDRQLKYHKYTALRDTALITTLLGTGMRVSECVGIDMQHIDFENGFFAVKRKGGKEQYIYFGEEVEEILQKYLAVRHEIDALPGHEDALFLSMQKKRIGVRSVEKLVKKYASLITSIKKITPHKLRSTYGTQLYQESGDIYLVADVLGHTDVNTTKKHYADMAEDNRKRATKYVKLRRA